MSPLRVLFVCNDHPSLAPGEAQWAAHDLFLALKEQGDVQAMLLAGAGASARPPRGDVRLQTVGRSADEALLWVGDFDPVMLAPREGSAALKVFADLLAQFRPHVVHFHHFRCLGLEALAVVRRILPHARIVATLHDHDLICANDGRMVTTAGTPCGGASLDACRRCLEGTASTDLVARDLHVRNLIALVDRFVTPSRSSRERLLARGAVARGKVQAIPYGLADRPASVAPRADQPRRSFGIFAAISPERGLSCALTAAQLLSEQGTDAAMRIHALAQPEPGDFTDQFMASVAQAASVASYAGPCRRDELPALMARVDWVLVPTLSAPAIVLEAFHSGRPVIVPDTDAMREMVHDGINGLMFQRGDAGDLARTLRRAANEDALWQRLSAAIPPVPSLAEVVDRHLALYNALLRVRDLAAV
jgi:glycosyltransferase involved in cell wall biosynthesis